MGRLGLETDSALAREIGAHRQNVWRMRRRLGIPTFERMTRVRHLLGRVPDAVIARTYRCDALSVAKYRRRLGIPRVSIKAYNQRNRVQAHYIATHGLDAALEELTR